MHKNMVSINGNSLSEVWLKAFVELLAPGVENISNLIVSFAVGTDRPLEDTRIRAKLDEALLAKGAYQSRTTAHTIFPPLWNPQLGREKLYERYLRLLPKLKRLTPANYNGLYFERLVCYGAGQPGLSPINQLEHIISTYQSGNHRKAALQASIFDPAKDHTDQRQRGFPCLQHVFFTPENQTLTITGVYAKQYLFDRAYGNYLGLYLLGAFMAHEMGLTLTRVTCMASQAELGNSEKINKQEGRLLARQIQQSMLEKEPTLEG